MIKEIHRRMQLLPFFWRVPLKQRTKTRKKRKSFPILSYRSTTISLTEINPTSLSHCTLCFLISLLSSPRSAAAAVWVYWSHKHLPKPTNQQKTTLDIFSAWKGMWVAFSFCFNMRRVNCWHNTPTQDLSHSVALTSVIRDPKVTLGNTFVCLYIFWYIALLKCTLYFFPTLLAPEVAGC